MNIDPKNDGFSNLPPFKYGVIWGINVSFWGCNGKYPRFFFIAQLR